MNCKCLGFSVHGNRGPLLSAVHARHSSGGPTISSEQPESQKSRPWSGRGHNPSQGHDERQGRPLNDWRDERRNERRDGRRDERRDERGDERRDKRRDEGWDGRRNERVDVGERGRGGSSTSSYSRRDREFSGAEKRGRPGPATAGGSSTGSPQRQRTRTRSVRDEYDNDDDVDNDNEIDDVDAADDVDERDGADRRSGGTTGPSCLRDTLHGEALYGVFPVLAALRAKRRRIHRAFVLSSMDLTKRKDAGLVRQVEALCTEAGVEIVRTSRHELNLMSHDRPHQGLVLDVSPLEWASLDEFPPADQLMAGLAAETVVHGGGGGSGTLVPPVWLALDEVVDPQNLGAVVRSAYCLGAAGVLACARNCAPLSAVVSKASAGALEALQLYSCHNLPRTLLDARDNKGWAVLGAAAGSGSVPVGKVCVDKPTILVLGSEGFGLRTNVRRACGSLVRVDMAPPAITRGSGDAWPMSSRGVASADSAGVPLPAMQWPQQGAVLRGLVDSLNVSVATGILLHSLISSAAAAAAATAGAAPQEGTMEAAESEAGTL
ncbi:hypothetical protein VaNZ11_009924 [Volvox africanus]|uniref:rRNA methyltransferase 1, mitochondrial n=1 Tax=Volvox africanus TaxID=51714 RepID=A0ABQ5S8R2_9CHLO|nr:hypothetical protein VaNZ11_009924 [Volvox africanus]